MGVELTDLERRPADRDEVNWVTASFMMLFHLGAIAALFFFTWKAFFVAVVLWWMATSLGIGMCYHRLLTHRGYKIPKWLEYTLTIFATLALEGGPIFWVATHRIHHKYSDHEGDPHSPIDGKWWAHMGWILMGKSMHHDTSTLARYVPDLAKDKFHVWITKYHYVPMIVLGVALLAIGGWKFVLWGIFFRTVMGLHFTWLVNSATHSWGTRRFETRAALDQQLVGRDTKLGRRLAQQSSRASSFGSSRFEVVRDRRKLVRDLAPQETWPGEADSHHQG